MMDTVMRPLRSFPAQRFLLQKSSYLPPEVPSHHHEKPWSFEFLIISRFY
jgi:hypothetical protein